MWKVTLHRYVAYTILPTSLRDLNSEFFHLTFKMPKQIEQIGAYNILYL